MAISLNNVSYFNEINDVSFALPDNKILGILGPRNSGKSALVDLIGGNFSPNEGFVFVSKSFGIVYQDISDQFFYDTVKEEFLFQLKVKGVRNIYKKMFDAVKLVGLDVSILDRSPLCLSLSEQKKISLALTLSSNSDIFIFDDLFFGLDNRDKESIIKLIRMLKVRYGKTIVFTSSDSDLVLSLSDMVLLMNNGEVIDYGEKMDVFSDIESLKASKVKIPDLISFSNFVLERKGVNLGYRHDVNDLMKDIYRFVR